jgi:peptidoglycan/LPS O-acetylase OafA/YrhL
MFLVGVLAQRNFALLAKSLRSWLLPILLPTYLGYALLLHRHGFGMDNSVSPLVFFPLAVVVLVGAFSATALARKLLRGQDVSYGIYIYHVVVMNMFLFYHRKDRLIYTVLVLAITVAVALASWFLVERPCLKRKHHPSHPVLTSPQSRSEGPSLEQRSLPDS